MKLSSFIGHVQTSIDAKGRTAYPREFRRFLTEEDGEELVIAPGPEQSLMLYTLPEWERYIAVLENRPRTQANERFLAQTKQYAAFCEMDGQNRITIPAVLQQHAMLEGQVVFASGSRGKTTQLWRPERYNEKFGLNTPEALAAFDSSYYDVDHQEVR